MKKTYLLFTYTGNYQVLDRYDILRVAEDEAKKLAKIKGGEVYVAEVFLRIRAEPVMEYLGGDKNA